MASWASRSESERENFVWWLRSTLSEERIWTIQLLESRATTRRYSGRAVRGSPLCRTASLEVVGIVEPSKINQWAKIAGELRARGGSVVRVAVAARKEADGSAPANAFASPDEKDTKDYGAFRKLVRAAYGRAAGADPDAKIDGRAGAERRPAPGARAWGSGSLAERKRAAGVALAAARAAVAGCPDWAHVDVSDFDEVWRSAVTRSPRGGPGEAPQVSSGLQVRGVLPADRARALADALAPVQRRWTPVSVDVEAAGLPLPAPAASRLVASFATGAACAVCCRALGAPADEPRSHCLDCAGVALCDGCVRGARHDAKHLTMRVALRGGAFEGPRALVPAIPLALPGALDDRPPCDYCGKLEGATTRCSKCKSAFYCGRPRGNRPLQNALARSNRFE